MKRKEYHIHVDRKSVVYTEGFRKDISEFGHKFQIHPLMIDELAALGFKRDLVRGHMGDIGFEPTDAMTLKTSQVDELKMKLPTVYNICDRFYTAQDFIGYVEAEEVVSRRQILHVPHQHIENISVFSRPLKGPPYEITRADFEFHLTAIYDKSDTRSIDQLIEMGLYSAIFVRDDGFNHIAFTMQGQKREIAKLGADVWKHVKKMGGIVGSMKFEQLIELRSFGITYSDYPYIYKSHENPNRFFKFL